MYNLSKFCYLCFSSERKLISINRKDSSNASIQDKMVYCIAELINHEPNTQKFICPKCTNNLNFFYKFKQLILRNNNRLSEYIDNLRANSRSDKYDIQTTDFKTIIKDEPNLDPGEHNFEEEIDLDRCVTPTSDINENDSLFINVPNRGLINNFSGISTNSEIENKLQDIESKLYKCSICEKNFRRKDTLSEHIKLHSGVKTCTCSQCDKTFARKISLGVHEMTHSEIKPFRCEVCHKTFGQKIQLTYHNRMHSGFKPYLCSACNASFHRNSSLVTHMKTHSNIKEFECNICQKKFTLKQNLDAHVRSHLGLRPFVCKVCEKRFSVKCNLKDHMKIHQNIKNFKCDLCDKKFGRKTDLKRHTKTHEPKIDPKLESIECDVAILSEDCDDVKIKEDIIEVYDEVLIKDEITEEMLS